MAIGPFARLLAQIVVPVVAVLARAIPAAYGQALNNARKAGVDATEAAAPVFGKHIPRMEALQVLNITEKEIKADPTIVQKVSVYKECAWGVFLQFHRYFPTPNHFLSFLVSFRFFVSLAVLAQPLFCSPFFFLFCCSRRHYPNIPYPNIPQQHNAKKNTFKKIQM